MSGLSVLAAAALALQTLAAPQVKNPERIYQLSELKTVVVTAGSKKLRIWLMDTQTKRMEGMMFLKDKDVKMEQGMLFVFPESEPRSFWMRNTLIPLDIAYVAPGGKIVSTAHMKPLDESGVPSKGAAMYALEMKKGAFKKFGIKAGMKLGIPSSIRAKG